MISALSVQFSFHHATKTRTPDWMALMSVRYILEDVSSLMSFSWSWKITGRSHPMCVLVSDWMGFKACTTGFITVHYIEFHRILFCQMTWSLHLFFTIYAVIYDQCDLFQTAWHYRKAARGLAIQKASCLYVLFFLSAMAVSRWHAHLWFGGSWYSRLLSCARILNVSR